MSSPYFVAVDPSSSKLRMFFGRRKEIRAITSHLWKGDSVLLIGERRMGKTFLLYMIGNPAEMGADFYENLLDRQTGALLAELRRSTASYRWAFIDLLGLTSASGFYFQVLAQLAGEQTERLAALSPIAPRTFVNELTSLSDDLSRREQRAVVLVDESEKLLSLDESADIFACLKAAVQRCDAIDFLLAGDIKPHQTTPEFQNLQGVLHPIHLAPLDFADAEALVRIPVKGSLSFEDSALQRILELTGRKPCLVQILCDHLYEFVAQENSDEVYITLADFDRLWESELRSKVFESFDGALRDFFDGLQGDERDIFCFLAHKPLATVDNIVEALGIEPACARKGIDRLHRSHRIEKVASGFRISARIVEEFGVRFVVPPVARLELPEVQTLADMLTGESTTLEYKASMRWDLCTKQVNPDLEKAIAKTVAGFLNSEGGTLLIGVTDDRTVLGIGNDLKTLGQRRDKDGYEQKLRQVLTNALGPEFCQYQHVSFEEHEGKTVCIVRTRRSPKPVYFTDKTAKEFYIRVGNTTKPLDMQAAHNYISMHWPLSPFPPK